MYTALDHKNAQRDQAQRCAVGLCSGEPWCDGGHARLKNERQSYFPLKILDSMLKVPPFVGPSVGVGRSVGRSVDRLNGRSVALYSSLLLGSLAHLPRRAATAIATTTASFAKSR